MQFVPALLTSTSIPAGSASLRSFVNDSMDFSEATSSVPRHIHSPGPRFVRYRASSEMSFLDDMYTLAPFATSPAAIMLPIPVLLFRVCVCVVLCVCVCVCVCERTKLVSVCVSKNRKERERV